VAYQQGKIGLTAIGIFTVLGLGSPAFAQSAPVTPAPTPGSTASEHARAKPVGDPGLWFPADAYPPEARNAGQEGRTEFMVKVDAMGRITECDVVKSSGSILLDNATCDQIVTHGHFLPGVDGAGKPANSTWHSAMRWQLVATVPAVEESDVR